MNEIKFIEYITCTECAHKLSLLRGSALDKFVQERKGLMRCRGCRKLGEYNIKWGGGDIKTDSKAREVRTGVN